MKPSSLAFAAAQFRSSVKERRKNIFLLLLSYVQYNNADKACVSISVLLNVYLIRFICVVRRCYHVFTFYQKCFARADPFKFFLELRSDKNTS